MSTSTTPEAPDGGGRLIGQVNLFEYQYENPTYARIDGLFAGGRFATWMDTAWATMLMRQGIIPAEHAPVIAREALACLAEQKPQCGSFGGFEQWVVNRHGVEVGGSLTIGRTVPPLLQMAAVRHELLKLMPLILDVMAAILDKAEEQVETLMPGYTHWRHAQPTTFGHYLLSVGDPLARTVSALEDGYRLMSLNELGCGALSGTSLPIDRDLTSDYLGLEGLIENANDAVSYTDGYVMLTAALANVNVVMSRFAMDLNIWSSEEYGFVDVPWDRVVPGGRKEDKAHTHSHFMPNKTNNCPYLERSRVAAAEVLGQLTRVTAMGMRCAHADMHEMLHMADGVLDAIRATRLYIHPYLDIVPRTTVHAARMRGAMEKSWIAATELGNVLVMTQGISYRSAHDILNDFIHACKQRGQGPMQADFSLFKSIARTSLGRDLELEEAAFRRSLDPAHFIQVTGSKGGVSPVEVRRMLAERRAALRDARQAQETRLTRLEGARARLIADLDVLANQPEQPAKEKQDA